MAASNVPASVKVPTCTSEITYSVIGWPTHSGSAHSKSEFDHLGVAVHAVGLRARRGIGQQRVADRVAVPSAEPEPGDERACDSRALRDSSGGGQPCGPVTTTSTRCVLGRPDAELDTAVARPGADSHGSGRRNSAPRGGSWSVSDQYHSRSGTGTASTPPRLPVPEPP